MPKTNGDFNSEPDDEIDLTLFMRPAEVTLTLDSHIQRFVVNLDQAVIQILDLMESSFEK